MAVAVKDHDFRQVIQPLSGYHLGWERVEVWRVRIDVGKTRFLSDTVYATEASAKSAAKRISTKATEQKGE